jgi:hypothetical protein
LSVIALSSRKAGLSDRAYQIPGPSSPTLPQTVHTRTVKS